MPPSPEPPPLRVEEISTLPALEALRPEWDALWARCPQATPFQSADWLIPWWRHLGEGRLTTLAVREAPGGALVALLPLYTYRQADGQRLLFPLGMGTTDYLDVLAPPPWGMPALALALAHLAARPGEWEAWEWPQLRPDAALWQAPAPPGWPEQRGEAEPCPLLPLGPEAPPLPPAMRQNLRTARHRAGRAGRLDWALAGPADLEEVFAAHLALHRARWRMRGEEGVLASPAVEAMHRAALPGLLRQGLLRLHALRLEGRIIATLHALADPPGRAGRRVYYYLGAFDPEYAALSPGALILGHAIEQAAAEGATGFDFLRGQEAYKYRWGARDQPTCRRRLHPPPSPRR